MKQLAGALGVGSHYVYQMRRCGFPMARRPEGGREASLDFAREWIANSGFHLHRSRGAVDDSCFVRGHKKVD